MIFKNETISCEPIERREVEVKINENWDKVFQILSDQIS